MSTSKLGDLSLVHLPDVTVGSLHADEMDASALGDLTTLSALSAEDSLLAAAVLSQRGAAHHRYIIIIQLINLYIFG